MEEHNTHPRKLSAKQNILARLTLLPSPLKKLFAVALFVFLGTSFALLVKLIDSRLVEVPRHGGMLVEGIIGRPRFINPVIAKSDADRDMTALVYSGLLRGMPDGTLAPDLARNFTISPDGLTYTFTLRDELVWHDGVAITSDDILFTVNRVRDIGLAIKSPRRAGWEGVEVSTPDAKTVIFKLRQPYAQFLENTTMGILPKHIWQNVPDEEFDVSYYNIDPIGSGPYRVKQLVRDEEGLPRYYDLAAFKRYPHGEPFITDLRMQFFGNNEDLAQAYGDGSIDQIHGLTPEAATALEAGGRNIVRTPLPRIFAIYFNQSQQPVFVDKAVRQALDLALDKDDVVAKVLHGYGKTISSPLPFLETGDASGTSTHEENIAQAKNILEKAGWRKNAANIYEKVDKKKKTVTLLQFAIALPDVPELSTAAELAKKNWEELGADVTVKVFEQSSFAGDVLSSRKYDAVLYGQVVGRDPDPYPYWHSSQRNAPGLNIALYTNKNADKLIESARKESDSMARNEMLMKFIETVEGDIPAIFLYSPDFLYATANKVHNVHIGLMTTESERFLGIENWYIDSERVWKFIAERMKRGE